MAWAAIPCLVLTSRVVPCGKELPHAFSCVLWVGFYVFGGGGGREFLFVSSKFTVKSRICSSRVALTTVPTLSIVLH